MNSQLANVRFGIKAVSCRWQLGSKKVVSVTVIEGKWHDLALPKELFDELLRIGNLTGDIEWLKFFAIACSSLAEVSRSTSVLFSDVPNSCFRSCISIWDLLT